MADDYFSDREQGPRPRTEEEIPLAVWRGLLALISALSARGAFGVDFPDQCYDDEGPIGTDEATMGVVLAAEIPSLAWPLDRDALPPTLSILDLLEFCHRHVASAIRESFHAFFRHHHLAFDRAAGQAEFREGVNRILARNGLAYELREDGRIERLGPPLLREALANAVFRTGDADLDAMLETARGKFRSPDPAVRREGLEKLWDAWERVKTLDVPGEKKASTAALLDRAAPEKTLRDALDKEATELTRIGNTFQIRHSETSQVRLERSGDVDYLFHRLFALVLLLLGARENAADP